MRIYVTIFPMRNFAIFMMFFVIVLSIDMDKQKKFSPKRNTFKKFRTIEQKRSASDKGYDSEWQRYRFRFLHHNPKCYVCSSTANHVDHLRAAKKGASDPYFWNKLNYAPLCPSCHSVVTGKFDRHDPPLTEEKMKWLQKRREELGTTVRIKVVPFKEGSGYGRDEKN